MMLATRRHLVPFALLLLSACTTNHVCGKACESQRSEGALPPSDSGARAAGHGAGAAAVASSAESVEVEAQEIGSAEALAAFDEAWQTIYDTHFDKNFNGVDWVALKDELRPRAERARTRDELRAVIGDMLERLGQSHFVVLPSEALPGAADGGGASTDQAGGLGFDVRLRGDDLLVTSVEPGSAAADAGVAPGWSVRRLDSFDVAESLAKMRGEGEALGERRTRFYLWNAAQSEILGPVGGKVRATFGDAEGRNVELELELRARDVTVHNVGPTLPTFYLAFERAVLEREGKRIGYVRFSNWFLPVMQPLNDAIQGMAGLDGVVIDLRGNTGGAGAMTMGVAGHFFGETKKLGVMTTRDSTLNILALPRAVNAAGERVQPFAGPLAIVIDETTGSASEVFAGGMQSVGRARVFGDTSIGAVLPAMTTRLPNGDALLHAMGDFETATGTRLEGVGVAPDVAVEVQKSDLLAGRDAPLETALAWITSHEQ